MIAGFLGTGTPEILIDALVKKGVKNLIIIANDEGLPAGAMGVMRNLEVLVSYGPQEW